MGSHLLCIIMVAGGMHANGSTCFRFGGGRVGILHCGFGCIAVCVCVYGFLEGRERHQSPLCFLLVLR